jgi:hypothetical protein
MTGTSLASRGSGDFDGFKEAIFMFLAQGGHDQHNIHVLQFLQ